MSISYHTTELSVYKENLKAALVINLFMLNLQLMHITDSSISLFSFYTSDKYYENKVQFKLL